MKKKSLVVLNVVVRTSLGTLEGMSSLLSMEIIILSSNTRKSKVATEMKSLMALMNAVNVELYITN